MLQIFYAFILLLGMDAVSCMCSVDDAAQKGRSIVVGFGPAGKFRAQHDYYGDVISMTKGEVELNNGKTYQCTRTGDWVKIPNLMDKHFKLYVEPSRPDQAFSSCEREGSVGATVYNSRQNSVMTMIMKMADVNVAVIGYSDSANEGTWVWDTENQISGEQRDAISSPRWADYQPDNRGPGEDYCAISSADHEFGNWYDIGPNSYVPGGWSVYGQKTKVPYWCEIDTTNDHFMSSVQLFTNGNKKNPSAGILHIEIQANVWTQVCHDTFTEASARVVCKMLGFSLGGTYTTSPAIAKAIKNNMLGEILLGDVDCDGTEESILDCPHNDDVQCNLPVWITCYKSCNKGKYITPDGTCQSCTPGHYSSSSSSSSCTECGVGFYQNSAGQRSCQECPNGLTTASPASTGLSECVSVTSPVTSPPSEATCGIRQFFRDTARIVGGVSADLGEFPWQVLLKKDGYSYCGGTLIDPTTVITAGHCFHSFSFPLKICYASETQADMLRTAEEDQINLVEEDIPASGPCPWFEMSQYTVDVGLTDRFSGIYKQTTNIARVFVSRRYVYNHGNIHNDIAVVKLDTPFAMNEIVQPACLPTVDTPIGEGLNLTITGFGSVRLGSASSRTLREAIVPFVPRDTCNEKMADRVSRNMFCAGWNEGGIDSCSGDSGGPIAKFDHSGMDDKYIQVGVISWGIGCARPDFYGVYTDIRQFLDFVEDAREGRISDLSTLLET